MAHRIRTHPGEILAEEFLKPLHMSVNALALELRVPPNRLGEIIKKRRTVTADTAMRLARFFGTTAEFWLNAQTSYDLSKAQAELGSKIARDVRPRAA